MSKTRLTRQIDIKRVDYPGAVSSLETVVPVVPERIDRVPAPTSLTLTRQTIAQSLANPQVNAEFGWTPPELSNPDSYLIQWSRNVNFSGVFNQASTTNYTTIQIDANTAYWVRVAAQKGIIFSEWSNVVSFTSMNDTTVPSAPSGWNFRWNKGHLEIAPQELPAAIKNWRVRLYDPTGTTLYKDIYIASAYILTAEENIRMTNGSPLTSFLVRSNARSWTNVQSTNYDVTTTSPVPSGITGVTTSWDSDTGIAGEDLAITWNESPGASKYIVEINNFDYTVTEPRFVFTYKENQTRFVSESGVARVGYNIWPSNDINQSGVATGVTTAINAIPTAPSLSVLAGFSSIYATLSNVTQVRDRSRYRFRIIPPSGSTTTITTDAPTLAYETQLTGLYRIGARILDKFEQQSNETQSSNIWIESLTLSGLRSQARYSDSVGTSALVLDGLKNNDLVTDVVTYGSGSAWKWTQCERDLVDRFAIVTFNNSRTDTTFYIGTTEDNINWRWFAGPVSAGRALTEVASESAAITAEVAVSALSANRIDLPLHEARIVRIYTRNISNSYALEEFYPRRMIQSDDIEAESIRAINIAAGTITTQNLAANAIDGMLITGPTIRTSASNPKVIMTSVSGLQTYNASNQEEIRLSTTDGKAYFAQNNITLGRDGIKVIMPASASDASRAYQLITYSGTTLGYLGGYYITTASPPTNVVELQANGISKTTTLQLEAYSAVLGGDVTSQVIVRATHNNGGGSSTNSSTITLNGDTGIILGSYNPIADDVFISITRTFVGVSGLLAVGTTTQTPNATLEVYRGTSAWGTAVFRGTVYNTHINNSTTEDTYIRGGKAGSAVFINDTPLGQVLVSKQPASIPADVTMRVNSISDLPDTDISSVIPFIAGSENGSNEFVGLAIRSRRTAAGSNRTGHAMLLQRFYDSTLATPYLSFADTGRLGVNVLVPSYELQVSTDSAGKPGTNTWTIVSDRRAKHTDSLRPYTEGLTTVRQLNPIYFKYNGKAGMPEDGMEYVGLDAQDIEQLTPNMIRKIRGKLNPDDLEETDILGVNNGDLIYMLVNAVKDLDNRVQQLEA